MNRSAKSCSTSFSVMSLRSSIIPTMKSASASRREPRRRPSGRGVVSPLRPLPIQRIALDIPTPNRAAAWRADAHSPAFTTRDRRSSPSALAIVQSGRSTSQTDSRHITIDSSIPGRALATRMPGLSEGRREGNQVCSWVMV